MPQGELTTVQSCIQPVHVRHRHFSGALALPLGKSEMLWLSASGGREVAPIAFVYGVFPRSDRREVLSA